MNKLSAARTAEYRAQALTQQGNLCALCDQHLNYADAVLDHDHGNGQIRKVLHRFCNTFLGKIENSVQRNRITALQLTAILRNYETYVSTHEPLLHHTHRTPEQKLVRARKRAQKRRKAKQ